MARETCRKERDSNRCEALPTMWLPNPLQVRRTASQRLAMVTKEITVKRVTGWNTLMVGQGVVIGDRFSLGIGQIRTVRKAELQWIIA